MQGKSSFKGICKINFVTVCYTAHFFVLAESRVVTLVNTSCRTKIIRQNKIFKYLPFDYVSYLLVPKSEIFNFASAKLNIPCSKLANNLF